MLFLVGRGDTEGFRPAWEIDPAYGAALEEAVGAGVEVVCQSVEVSREGLRAGPVLPYDLVHD